VCGLELPDLETNIWNRYRARGLRVIGLDPPVGSDAPADSLDDVTAFGRREGVTFPLGVATTDVWRRLLSGLGDGAAPFPTRVLINRDGSVAYISSTIDPDGLRSAIELALRP
jgi:hypothetical protein